MGKYNKPLKWSTPEELEEKIEQYFEWAKENKRYTTITDLAYYLGTNRQTLLNYENSLENEWLNRLDDKVKVLYVDTIKRAKARIEANYEQGLFHKDSVVGTIFTLKNNYGWVDKQEIVQENREIKVELTD